MERLAGDWRFAAVGELIEPPSHMRPAEREAHVALFGEGAVAGVAVDLENALEAGEMRDRLRRFAVGRVDIGDRRRVRSAPGPVVSRTGPKLAGLDAPAARIEHRRRRLVGSSTTAESKWLQPGGALDQTHRSQSKKCALRRLRQGASYCSSRHPLISQRDFFGDCQTAAVATAERWLRSNGLARQLGMGDYPGRAFARLARGQRSFGNQAAHS